MHIWIWSLITAVLAPLLGRVAARQSLIQPIGVALEAEAELLGLVITDPSRYFQVCLLEPDHFAWSPHRRIFTRIAEAAVPSEDPAELAEAAAAGVTARTIPLDATELRAFLAAGLDSSTIGLVAELAEGNLRSGGLVSACNDEAVVLAIGAEVLACGDDRAGFQGALLLEDAAPQTRARPLVRVARPVSWRRDVSVALLAAASGALAASLVGDLLAQAALCVLVLGCLVLSLVDIDTMFIDFPTLAVTGLVAWAFAVPYGYIEGGLVRVGVSLGVTIAIVGTLELLALVHGRIRNTVSLGGGDSVLLLVTLSVPLLVSGDSLVAVWGILGATMLALVVRIALIVTGRSTMQEPFAFGPYLAAGWLLGWVLLAVGK